MSIGKGIRTAGETLIKVADIHDTFFGVSSISLTRTAAAVDKGASAVFPKSVALKPVGAMNRKWGMVHLIRSISYTVGWVADANTQFEARFFWQIGREDTGLRDGGAASAGTQIPTMDTAGAPSIVHEWRGSFSETDPIARITTPFANGTTLYQELPIPIPMVRPYYFNFGAEVTKSNAGTIIIVGTAYLQIESIRVPVKKYQQLLNEYTRTGDQGKPTPR